MAIAANTNALRWLPLLGEDFLLCSYLPEKWEAEHAAYSKIFITYYKNIKNIKNIYYILFIHFIRKKTRWKTLLWWIISSERKHKENQDHAIVLLIIKAGGKLLEARMTITDFMKHSAWAAPCFITFETKLEIKLKKMWWQKYQFFQASDLLKQSTNFLKVILYTQ